MSEQTYLPTTNYSLTKHLILTEGTGGGDTGWSALTEAGKIFGPEAITQKF